MNPISMTDLFESLVASWLQREEAQCALGDVLLSADEISSREGLLPLLVQHASITGLILDANEGAAWMSGITLVPAEGDALMDTRVTDTDRKGDLLMSIALLVESLEYVKRFSPAGFLDFQHLMTYDSLSHPERSVLHEIATKNRAPVAPGPGHA